MTSEEPKASTLESEWASAARLLGLETIAPFSVTLPSGTRVCAEVLVKHFGAANGMLIVRDYEQVRHVQGELEEAGFGFSVLEDPRANEPFVLEEFADILRDWGWAGKADEEPEWMGSS